MTIDLVLYTLAVFSVGFIIGRAHGLRQGRARERARCLDLCYQSWRNGVMSGTARRVAHSIDEGHAVLISNDDFFSENRTASYREPAKLPDLI